MKELVSKIYRERFGESPAGVVRAPGRVNLIGEHTDYNDGFVLPMAIEKASWIAFGPASDGRVQVYSENFGEEKSFGLDDLASGRAAGEGWIEYVKGVAWALRQQAGVGASRKLVGWRGVVAGDVPVGSGLSSSASLEMAVGRVFAAVSEFPIGAAELAQVGQAAENSWVGMNCGIMDQLASAAGERDRALLIDCRSLEVAPVPLPEDFLVVIMDTGTRRKLVDSAYNERRAQCEAGAKLYGVPALRDLTIEDFEARADELEILTLQRCRHVVTENARTLQAATALRQGDAERFGILMNESHESLRRDFEVSSPALDAMVEIAREHPGCVGARMTGAGFGGCAVALVRRGTAEDFVSAVSKRYLDQTQNTPTLFLTRATEGAASL